MTPSKLEAKQFEELILESAEREEKHGRLSLSRYGVMSSFMGGQWRPIESLPDFEGDLAGGRHCIIEAKTCSAVSFPLEKKSLKPKQVAHMLKRARIGVPCFILIHFNERPTTAAASYPGMTIAIRVSPENPMWQRFVDAYAEARKTKGTPEAQGSISRNRALELGQIVPWRSPRGCRKALPDLLSFLDPDCPREEQLETPSFF